MNSHPLLRVRTGREQGGGGGGRCVQLRSGVWYPLPLRGNSFGERTAEEARPFARFHTHTHTHSQRVRDALLVHSTPERPATWRRRTKKTAPRLSSSSLSWEDRREGGREMGKRWRRSVRFILPAIIPPPTGGGSCYGSCFAARYARR